MKKLSFICIVCLCAATQTNAQLRDTTVNMNMHKVDANSLLQKTKKQKTAAWIMLGGGAGLAIAGYIIRKNEAVKDPVGFFTGEITTGTVVFIAGDAAILGSIPLFTASAKNKRKANLMLKNETVFFNPQLNIKEHIVSLALKINL